MKRFPKWLAIAQIAHPKFFVIIGITSALIAGGVASLLKIDSSYAALLPDESPQMQNVDDVRSRTGGTRQVVIAISGGTKASRIEFGRALSQRLSGVKSVGHVSFEIPVGFFKQRAVWIVDDETLDELVVPMDQAMRLLREKNDRQGLKLALGRVQDALESTQTHYGPNGVRHSQDGRYTFLIVVPTIDFYDIESGTALLGEIESAIEQVNPGSFGVEVRQAGNLKMVQEIQARIVSDLQKTSLIALFFGIFVVIVMTRRTTAPLVIGIPLLSGVAWTFALAYLLVGRLNVITGFLVAVLIGLGIDFGIHLYVRYRQELSNKDIDFDTAIFNSVTGTFTPALTSALTTAGTFFSFSFADFKGFSEFGLIAGFGVIFTFASCFLLLPALLMLVKKKALKHRPTIATPTFFGRTRIPLPIATGIVVIFGGIALFGGFSITDIEYRNDFRRLAGRLESTDFQDYVDENLGVGFNPSVVIVDDLDQVSKAISILNQRQDEIRDGEEGVAVRKILSIYDLLPQQDSARREKIERLRQHISEPVLDELVGDNQERAAQLAEGRAIAASEPWTVEEIPESLRRRFQTVDETQYVVYFWPHEANTTDRQAVAWERELAELESRFRAAGLSPQIADETLITSWVYQLVKADGPRLLLVASLVVFIFLLFDLRSLKGAALVAFPLATGMLVLVAVMRIFHIDLNIFNIIVLPSIIGIGIDNSVHIYHRYKSEGRGSVVLVMRRTGWAALTASLTTGVSFGSSLVSYHVGLQTLGALAMIGIGITFVSAAIFFPSVLDLMEGRKRAKS